MSFWRRNSKPENSFEVLGGILCPLGVPGTEWPRVCSFGRRPLPSRCTWGGVAQGLKSWEASFALPVYLGWSGPGFEVLGGVLCPPGVPGAEWPRVWCRLKVRLGRRSSRETPPLLAFEVLGGVLCPPGVPGTVMGPGTALEAELGRWTWPGILPRNQVQKSSSRNGRDAMLASKRVMYFSYKHEHESINDIW